MSNPKQELMQIKAATGLAPWYVLHCPVCPNVVANCFENESKFQWALKLRCARCNTQWWVCTICSDQRSHMKTVSQATRHNRNNHKEEKLSPVPMSSPTPSRMDVISNEFFPRPASYQFFTNCQKGKGIEHLVARAVFKTKTVLSQLDKKDVHTFMVTAHFVSTISRSQRENLANLIQNVFETTKRHIISEPNSNPPSPRAKRFKSESPPAVQIEPLTTKQAIRSTIIEGKNALFENIAHPFVYTHGNHAYVLPSKAVADFIAHGVVDSTPPKVQSLGQSRMAKQLRQQHSEECMVLYASFWSDGFDPNYTLSNRGSVWVKTMTIQQPHASGVKFFHVYPIIVGKEGDNHKDVLEIIWNDVKSLKNVTMYDGCTGKNVQVSVEVIAITQDQP